MNRPLTQADRLVGPSSRRQPTSPLAHSILAQATINQSVLSSGHAPNPHPTSARDSQPTRSTSHSRCSIPTSMSVDSVPAEPQPAPPASSVEIATLTTRAAIEAHLQALSFQESSLDSRLATLISSRAQLAAHLNALNGLEEVVAGIQGEAEVMADRVGEVAETAERVGGKVRILDQEQVQQIFY